MSKEQANVIEYLVCVIGAFAWQFSLTNALAYKYLRQYEGLAFLTKHYGAEHTLSIEDTVEDIAIICNRHGNVDTMKLYHDSSFYSPHTLVFFGTERTICLHHKIEE